MMLVSMDGVTVGEETADLFLTDVEVSLGDVRTGDVERPLRHGSRPGVDYLEAGSITLSLCTSPHIVTDADADAAAGRFMRAWRSGLSVAPGAMVPLRVTVDGRTRIVYGRPGRVAPPAPGSVAMAQGIAAIIAEFRVLDPLVYDPVSTALSISVVPRSLGGIIAPIVTPVTTTLTSDTSYRVLSVGGEGPAPLRVVFHGPATDPRVTVGGAEVGIAGRIAYDEDVVVDGRDRTVTLADGTQASHRLSWRSRLDRLTVEPGEHEISFTATDRTGTARVTVEATPTHFHL